MATRGFCFVILALTALLTQARAWGGDETPSVCCPRIGCFYQDEVFGHLPLPECPETTQPRIGLFTRQNPTKEVFLTRDTTNIPSVFDPAKRTAFLVHGYTNAYDTDYMIDWTDTLLKVEDLNVIRVGWHKGADNLYYPQSASNTRTTGAEIALIIENLVKYGGASGSRIWCIGFSLGAQTCGHAGMRVGDLGRITALSPAGPSFASHDAMSGVNPTSAKLVDVIHTDGSGHLAHYGTLHPVGHRDFYPNGGHNQPGCWTRHVSKSSKNVMDPAPTGQWSVSCSHSRAVSFFKATIENPDCFVARMMCTDYNNMPGSCYPCPGGDCGRMGYAADQKTVQGIFYLETTADEPFCGVGNSEDTSFYQQKMEL